MRRNFFDFFLFICGVAPRTPQFKKNKDLIGGHVYSCAAFSRAIPRGRIFFAPLSLRKKKAASGRGGSCCPAKSAGQEVAARLSYPQPCLTTKSNKTRMEYMILPKTKKSRVESNLPTGYKEKTSSEVILAFSGVGRHV